MPSRFSKPGTMESSATWFDFMNLITSSTPPLTPVIAAAAVSADCETLSFQTARSALTFRWAVPRTLTVSPPRRAMPPPTLCRPQARAPAKTMIDPTKASQADVFVVFLSASVELVTLSG